MSLDSQSKLYPSTQGTADLQQIARELAALGELDASEEELALLGQGPTDIGDPLAVPLDAMRDDTFVVRVGDASWTAERRATGWFREGSDEDVGEAIREIVNVGIRYQSEPVAAASSVAFTTEVWRGDDSVIVDFGPGEEGWLVGQDRRGGAPYKADADALGFLPELVLP